MEAKYTYDLKSLELVNPDKGTNSIWSFRLEGNGGVLLRKMKKVDHDKPGTEYRW